MSVTPVTANKNIKIQTSDMRETFSKTFFKNTTFRRLRVVKKLAACLSDMHLLPVLTLERGGRGCLFASLAD